MTWELRLRELESDNKKLHDEIKILHNLYRHQQQLIKEYIRKELIEPKQSQAPSEGRQ